jgi:hypothetical protein
MAPVDTPEPSRSRPPAVPGLHALFGAANDAAAAGDYAAAERHLREALRLQEEALGASHPDLANTLNNLGVACEMVNRPDAAEHAYRRAHAIASASLPPDDPLVVTSAKNLREFCEARGIPFDAPSLPRSVPVAVAPAAPAPTPPVAAPPAPARAAPAIAPASTAPPPAGLPSAPPRPFPRTLAVGVLGMALLVVLIVALLRLWPDPGGSGSAPERPVPSGAGTTPPPAASSRAPVEPVAEAPADADPPAGAEVAASGAPSATPAPAVPTPPDPTPSDTPSAAVAGSPAASGTSPRVAAARVCATLSTRESRDAPGEWQCDAADPPLHQGPLYFYTRVLTTRDTTVQHRWYVGDRLRQTIRLRVPARPTRGYRTYSRVTVFPAEDWRVELRASDDTLLYEERFDVR